MFPKSLFAFVATSLFLANVGVEASPKPNRPDAFDSYPSDRFRKARVDKRYIPPSEFQEYYAKANGDGRVFRNAPLWRQATSKDTPIVATTVKAKKPTPDTKITSDYVYPSRHQQGAPLPITITSLLFTTPADKGFLGICSLQGASIDGIFGNSSYSFAQQFINEAQKTARCNWLSPTDVRCVEHGGKEDMNSEETTWWQQAFCKRCSDAGGRNREDFACPPKASVRNNDVLRYYVRKLYARCNGVTRWIAGRKEEI